MKGQVSQRRILLNIAIRFADGRILEIEFVVDTGFQGFLALPPATVAALGLPYRDTIAANLANDTDVDLEVYEAVIVWEGRERAVDVLATGRRPLLGAALLEGFHLGVDFVESGLVEVVRLAGEAQV